MTIQLVFQLLRLFRLLGCHLGGFQRGLGASLSFGQCIFSLVQRVKLSQHRAAGVTRASTDDTAGVEHVALDGDAVQHDISVIRDSLCRGLIFADESLTKNILHHVLHVVVIRHEAESERGFALAYARRRGNLTIRSRSAVDFVQRNYRHTLLELTLSQKCFTGDVCINDNLVQLTSGDDFERGDRGRVLHLHELSDDAFNAFAVKLRLGIAELKVAVTKLRVQYINFLL